MGLFDKLVQTATAFVDKTTGYDQIDERKKMVEEERIRQEQLELEKKKQEEQEAEKKRQELVDFQNEIDNMDLDKAFEVYEDLHFKDPGLVFRAVQILTGVSKDIHIDVPSTRVFLNKIVTTSLFNPLDFQGLMDHPEYVFLLSISRDTMVNGVGLERSNVVSICKFLENKGITSDDLLVINKYDVEPELVSTMQESTPEDMFLSITERGIVNNRLEALVKFFNDEKLTFSEELDYYIAFPGFWDKDLVYRASVCSKMQRLPERQEMAEKYGVSIECFLKDGKMIPAGLDKKSKFTNAYTMYNILAHWAGDDTR